MMPLTPGRRTLLTFGIPLSLAFVGYGALGIINAIGLTHYTQTVTLTPTTKVLTVSAAGGYIHLEASADANMHVLAKGVYSLSKPRMTVTSTPAGVTVKARSCSGGVFICNQDLVIQVPTTFQISAHSSGGDVSADGAFTGDLDLNSSAGDVSADGVSGPLILKSSAGDVDGRNLRSLDVTASSSAGDVDVRFATAPTRVEAGSSAGDVDVRVPVDVQYHVTTQSSAGDHVSSVPENSSSSHTINAHSSAGDVDVSPTP